MPRYIAFLRAVNVGGHNLVKMDSLRRLFGSLGFSSVETFIASGNIVFESTPKDARILEREIANGLREALGYEVATFIRTGAELAAVADYKPFSQSDLDGAVALNIAFLADKLDDKSLQKLMALMQSIAQNPLLMQAFVKRYDPDHILSFLMKAINLNPMKLELSPDEKNDQAMQQRMAQLQQMTQITGGAKNLNTQPGGGGPEAAMVNQTSNPLTGLTGGEG